jgi:hypothetical protein
VNGPSFSVAGASDGDRASGNAERLAAIQARIICLICLAVLGT